MSDARPVVLLDVSSYQGTRIDWRRVKRAGVSGVWVKATEGAGYINPVFRAQAKDARAAGLRVGFYHFARPDSVFDAAAEASHFATTTAGQRTLRDLRPVLDFESWVPVDRVARDAVLRDAAGLVTWARTWTQTVRLVTGDGPIFYSYPAFIERMAPRTPIGYGLWLASYGSNDGQEHPYRVPKPWRRAVAHQFTSRGRVPGCPEPVDVSHAPALRPLLAHPVRGLV